VFVLDVSSVSGACPRSSRVSLREHAIDRVIVRNRAGPLRRRRPDVPNADFVVQADQRNLRANRGLSDLDRTHRFSLSYTYQMPGFSSNSLRK